MVARQSSSAATTGVRLLAHSARTSTLCAHALLSETSSVCGPPRPVDAIHAPTLCAVTRSPRIPTTSTSRMASPLVALPLACHRFEWMATISSLYTLPRRRACGSELLGVMGQVKGAYRSLEAPLECLRLQCLSSRPLQISKGHPFTTLPLNRGCAISNPVIVALFQMARKIAIEEGRPCLIEGMTYRIGAHSTSDDDSKYRRSASPEEGYDSERSYWDARSPIIRFGGFLESHGLWTAEEEAALRKTERARSIKALNEAEKVLSAAQQQNFPSSCDVKTLHSPTFPDAGCPASSEAFVYGCLRRYAVDVAGMVIVRTRLSHPAHLHTCTHLL